MRFASHRDIARALERAIRRAGIPVAFSAGYTPHPKISYAGAAPTGVASLAEYFECTLAESQDPGLVRARLDDAMPDGIDIVDVVAAGAGGLADRLEASEWQVEMPGVAPDGARTAAAAFLAAESVEVERLTKKGRRRFDTRGAVLRMEVEGHATTGQHETCAILRMVVRHTTPAVRPDDVVTGLRQVADLAPPSSTLMTRLAQGPLDEASGAIADPFAVNDGTTQNGEPERAAPKDGSAQADPAGRAEEKPRSSSPARDSEHA
ncbi:radical SAM-linked protein [Lipingzhangella halophila]|uniref:Radical SAM-linked protein n=1 Tax=Lipingzhangella halophila TaxID=1783352 RepID=A0A7W7RJT8_9ACTN|nr:TIGR03936 family radical SAM-associated protein [Lipingzhangella halophila]MBB4933202.1 radical SAM-linked protein [Lipingzhangella halophila]